MTHNYCGLDFGTSNSAICTHINNELSLVPIENNAKTIPSAIFFNADEHSISYGKTAMEEYLDGYAGRLLRSLKSVLGSSLINEKTRIGFETYAFKDIISLFLKQLKQRSETYNRCSIDKVVLGRPVYFVDNDPIADKRAENELRSIVEKIGFQDISFEFEPIAAAKSYETSINNEELVLIFDIGGGTSDFSVIRLDPQKIKHSDRRSDILANSGLHIGGTDFDTKFSLQSVMPEMGYKDTQTNGLTTPSTPYRSLATWHLINTLYSRKELQNIKEIRQYAANKNKVGRFLKILEHKQGHQVASTVEGAKIALTSHACTIMDFSFIEKNWNIQTTAQELENTLKEQLEDILKMATKTVTNDAGINASDINTIFMTGGSTALPYFEHRIKQIFPNAKISQENRFSSVATGLGLTAQNRYS